MHRFYLLPMFMAPTVHQHKCWRNLVRTRTVLGSAFYLLECKAIGFGVLGFFWASFACFVVVANSVFTWMKSNWRIFGTFFVSRFSVHFSSQNSNGCRLWWFFLECVKGSVDGKAVCTPGANEMHATTEFQSIEFSYFHFNFTRTIQRYFRHFTSSALLANCSFSIGFCEAFVSFRRRRKKQVAARERNSFNGPTRK